MSDEIKTFLACLATCPVVALAIVIMMILDGGSIEHEVEALGVWAMLTAILAIVVLAAGGMYFVWTWAL